MKERPQATSTAPWRHGRGAPTPWLMRPVFYDFAWAALHRPRLWARVSGRLLPEERARIVRECRSIARSRKGRRTGRPVLRPSDPELARDVWATCARMMEVRG